MNGEMIYKLMIESYKNNIDLRARLGYKIPAEEKTMYINTGRRMGHSTAAAMLLKNFSDSIILTPTWSMATNFIQSHTTIERSKVRSVDNFLNIPRGSRPERQKYRFIMVDAFTHMHSNKKEKLLDWFNVIETDVDMFILLG